MEMDSLDLCAFYPLISVMLNVCWLDFSKLWMSAVMFLSDK